MKFTILSTLLLLDPSTSFLTPIPAFSRSTATRTFLVEPKGSDAFVALVEEDKGAVKQVRDLPTPLRKFASVATIPLSAAAGFLMTPSRRVVASAVGSVVSGVGGVVVKSKLDDVAEKAAKGAVARLLMDKGIDDCSLNDIEQIRADFGVENGEWATIKTSVYTRYLLSMLRSCESKTTEAAELTRLADVLGLSSLDVGEAHYEASTSIYKDHVMWTTSAALDDVDDPDRKTVDKLLYLSERVFKQEETDEAYNYEMMRVGKVFGLSLNDVPGRVGLVAKPFYGRALMSSRTKIDQVSSDMLSRARTSIGIEDGEAMSMHLSAYTAEVRELLKIDGAQDASACTLNDAAREKLSKLKGILQIDDLQAQRAVESETIPLYRACVADVLKEASSENAGSLSSLVAKLAIRQNDLDISGEAVEKALADAVQANMNDKFALACQYARVNNIEGTTEIVRQTLNFKSAVFNLLRKISTEVGEDGDAVLESTYFGSVGAYGEGVKERPLIYKQFLTSKLAANGNTLNEGDYDELEEVKKMFDVPAMDASLVFKNVVGPTLRDVIESTTKDILDLPRSNAEIMAVVDGLRIPADTLKEFSLDVFRTRIRTAADSAEGGLISDDQSKGLEALWERFGFSPSDVKSIVTATLGPAYSAAVVESMGETGIISEMYTKGLEDLKGRLLLTDEAAQSIKMSAFADKFAPMCAELVKTMETKPEDKKEDAGNLAAKSPEEQFQEDALALIEFLKGNNIATKKEVGTEEVTEKQMVKKTEKQMVKKMVKKIVQKPMDSGIMQNIEVEEEVEEEEDVEVEVEEEVTKSVPSYKYNFPMTAQSVSAVSDEKATAAYRQFIVNSFQAKEPLATKYAEAGDELGMALGLDDVELNKVKGGIGATIFDNYFSNAMKDKVEMDQQDFMFLTQIQERLGFSDDIVERLLVSSQKNLLSKEVERLFSSGTKIEPSAVAAVVNKAELMDINLNRDLGVDDDRLGRMFSIQVMGGIEGGDITATNGGDKIGEICEGLGIAADVGERRLEALVKDRAKRMVTNIASDVARGNDERAMKDLPVFLSYASFAGGEDLGLKVAENVRDNIVAVYESATFGQTGSGEMVELLRRSLE